jgi:Flagellar hook-length control protein FliK
MAINRAGNDRSRGIMHIPFVLGSAPIFLPAPVAEAVPTSGGLASGFADVMEDGLEMAFGDLGAETKGADPATTTSDPQMATVPLGFDLAVRPTVPWAFSGLPGNNAVLGITPGSVEQQTDSTGAMDQTTAVIPDSHWRKALLGLDVPVARDAVHSPVPDPVTAPETVAMDAGADPKDILTVAPGQPDFPAIATGQPFSDGLESLLASVQPRLEGASLPAVTPDKDGSGGTVSESAEPKAAGPDSIDRTQIRAHGQFHQHPMAAPLVPWPQGRTDAAPGHEAPSAFVPEDLSAPVEATHGKPGPAETRALGGHLDAVEPAGPDLVSKRLESDDERGHRRHVAQSGPESETGHTAPRLTGLTMPAQANPETISQPIADPQAIGLDIAGAVDPAGLSLDPSFLPGLAGAAAAPDAHRTVSVALPQVVAKLVESFAMQSDGTTTLTLSPEELGQVRLDFQSDRQSPDRIVVMLGFDRPETMELFRRNIDQLTEALRTAGYAGVQIGFASGGGEGPRQGLDQDAAPVRAEEVLTAAGEATPLYWPAPIGGQGALNLRL